MKDSYPEKNLYNLKFDTSQNGFLIENNGKIIDVNQVACKLFGISCEELVGLSVDELINKRLKKTEEIVQNITQDNEDSPVYFINAANKYCIILKSTLFKSASGISTIYTIREAITKRGNDYNLLANTIKDMIIIFDSNENVTFVNNKVHDFYGFTKDDAIGKKLSEFIPEQSYDLLQKYIIEKKSKSSENQPLEIRISNKDKNIVNIEVLLSFIDNDQNKETVLIAKDITYKKALERQVQKSQRMNAVEKMAGGMAHDFNNLLTIILGNNKILLEKLSGQTDINQNLMQIEKASRRAETLTRQLLSFSGQQSLHPQKTTINDLVSTLISLIEQSLVKNVTLVSKLEEGIGSILVDSKKLEISIYNLISNAAESMDDGGEIIVKSKEFHLKKNLQTKNLFTIVAGEYILLEIKYPGTEIEEDDLLNVFEPFQSNNKLYENNGLDLPSIYGFIKQSGGYIDIDSGPGKGTTFKLYFPIYSKEDEIEDIEEIENIAEDDEEVILYKPDPTILVAEDEYDLNELICDVLVYNGYRIMFALNGKEALEIVENNPDKIDLILSDVIMPEMGGPEFVREAKKIAKPLKIIYMSGYTDKAISLIENDDRKFEFLQKPFTPDDLLKKIKSLMETGYSKKNND
jgi:two-component system cell cycle sensor histidine kinase/response regulator CckA